MEHVQSFSPLKDDRSPSLQASVFSEESLPEKLKRTISYGLLALKLFLGIFKSLVSCCLLPCLQL